VGRSDLDNVALEKELPQEVVNKVKEIRLSLAGATFPSSSQQKNIQRIQRALDSDDVELVKLLLQEGVGQITLDDAYALHYAAAYCDPKITSELLELGCADVNLKNPRGYTVLHMAAMRREPATIVALLTKGAHPSDLTSDERTALQISKRLTRSIDYFRPTDEGKESPKDRLCIEILEQAESRNPLRAEVPLSLAFAGEDLRTKLLDLENRGEILSLITYCMHGNDQFHPEHIGCLLDYCLLMLL
jgi:regulatory protein NPR1